MRFCLLFICCLCVSVLNAQIIPDSITIIRDQWGVPHIYAQTDAEVAYGFAWATAEDDFETIQKQLLPAKGLLGQVVGKEGAILDVVVHLLNARELTAERYEKDLSPEFIAVLEAYASGLNAYAAAHPQEILHRKLFPINGKDIIPSYVLGLALMSNMQEPLGQILEGGYPIQSEEHGSNAAAIAPHKTTTGETFLLINSHQPLEGLFSWYEAHLCSEEGWNILGATFPGGVTIFHGTNPHLGWAHTVNHPDFNDVYRLEMHPDRKFTYKYDDEWLALEPYPYKVRIRLLGFLPFGIKQKYYRSKYGITFKTKNGFFALRTTANQNIKAAEQWYQMNKASNYAEFREALEMQGINSTNIIYADKEGNIYYISNGLFPKRNPNFDWKEVLQGNTSATLWKKDFYPIDSLAQVENPPSGYVFNCNHTPFLSSGPGDNLDTTTIPITMGYQRPNELTNRGVRFDDLISKYKLLSYEDFKSIKYDQAYAQPMPAAPKLEPIFTLNPQKYPKISESIALLNQWDRVADIDSEGASIIVLVFYFLNEQVENPDSFRKGNEINEEVLVETLAKVQKYLKKHFGRINVPLGELQRHSRGNINIPMGGAPDVLAAIYSKQLSNGHLRPVVGESYIQMVRFSDEDVRIESINAYGSSNKKESPHYTDQMEMFTHQQLKAMTLDKEKVMEGAKRVYHPQARD